MDNANLPLVSVPVVTYNSSKTIIETLDSIYNQTYPNIELIVSDDCSTDNTVELVRTWVKTHEKRFTRTEIITVEKNTGISRNLNRAESACIGEWVKGIAGDDLLTEDSIQACIDYVSKNKDTIFLFGRCKTFGPNAKHCKEVDSLFDYSFFSLPPKEQLNHLIFVGNCIPATTLFYNRRRFQELGIKNDERISQLEDWPRWINILSAGITLNFVDKVLVMYRIGGISTTKIASLEYYRSERQIWYYYRLPKIINSEDQKNIDNMIDKECLMYNDYLKLHNFYTKITKTWIYRLYKYIGDLIH